MSELTKQPTTDEVARELEALDQQGQLNSVEAIAKYVIAHSAKLREENERLVQWKRESIEVDKQWDCQKVGQLMGLTVGQNIRPQVETFIRNLVERVRELEKEITIRDNVINEMKRV